MDTNEKREKLYKLLLENGVSAIEIEKRKNLEKDRMINLYDHILNFKEEEIQYLFNSLKDSKKLGPFICLRSFILCLNKKGIPYWDNLKLVLDDEYWMQHPFTINWLDMYFDLSEENRTKYIKMLLEANKDPLCDTKIKPYTDRIHPITQYYFDDYHRIGMLDAYKREGISLYNSIQVHNYQVAYYIHSHNLSEESSIKVIDPLIEEIFKSMSEKELNKTFEFNLDKKILSHIKDHGEIYKPSLEYVKIKRYNTQKY